MRKLIAIALPLALAGCDLNAEAEADTVCVTRAFGSPIPGVPAGTNVTAPLALPATTIQVDVGDAIPDLTDEGVTADLPAKYIALTSVEGADLSGVASATFTLAGPTPADDVPFTYTRSAGPPLPVLETPATPSRPVDLADYLVGQTTLGVKNIAVNLNGQPPTTSWTPALRICFGTKIEVDYLKASGR